MTRAERVVLDTNVLISAVLSPDGPPGRLFDALALARAVLLFSDETRDELGTRLLLPRFDPYVSVAARREFLALLAAVAEPVAIHGSVMGCRDRSDDKFLETAVTGKADCIVTGDEDLLVLNPFREIPILRPADCLDRFFAVP